MGLLRSSALGVARRSRLIVFRGGNESDRLSGAAQCPVDEQVWAVECLILVPEDTIEIVERAQPVGTHEVIFRHPQFGEQRITATVTATAPARLSVDMRKK